jgi:erythrin-vacuolar iron transport family protein
MGRIFHKPLAAARALLEVDDFGSIERARSRKRLGQEVHLRSFSSLSEREMLALAIALEEEDARIYGDFAEGLQNTYPSTAAILTQMGQEEDSHRRRLLELFQKKFGDHIPLIRRHDLKGFVQRRPIWLVRPLGLSAVRKQIELMELETKRFYEHAVQQTTDASIRQLLGDLAEEERKHSRMAEELESARISSGAGADEAAIRQRMFVLQVIQPGLAGLMDGSVSTLAPLFAAAFATHYSWTLLSSAWRPAWAPASAWASPRPCLMTAA